MRKIVVLSFISLDGVVQAPGGPEEDASGDFKLGGWTYSYNDEEGGQEMGKQMSQPFDLLLGRKTYDIFANYWPKQEPGPVTDPFNAVTKYVASNSNVDASWENTVVLDGDVVSKLKELKDSDGPMLQVHGSGNFIQTLLKNDLVDELWLKTFPVTLGKGKRLFEDGSIAAGWKLTDTKVTPSGVIFANYTRDGEIVAGTVGE